MVLALGCWPRLSSLDQPPLWDDERSSLLGATGQTAILPFDINGDVTVEQYQLMWTPGIPGLRTGFTPADVWAKSNILNVFRATAFFDGSNGLLFNLMLHGWIELVALDDTSLRLLPVLLGMATLATIFIGLRAVGAGLLEATSAGIVAAGHPLLIWSSRELRPYALATLFVVVATFVMLRLVQECEAGRTARRFTPIYVVAAVGALMSHYSTSYIFVGHAIWAMLTLRNRYAWFNLIFAGAVVAGAFTLWIVTGGADGIKLMGVHNELWQQRAQTGQVPWLETTTFDRMRRAILLTFVQYLLLQPIQSYDETFLSLVPGLTGASATTLGWTLFGTALFLLAVASLWAVLKRNDSRAGLRLLMLILAAMGPMMAAVLALKSEHMLSFIVRYMAFSAPFAAIFVGLCGAALVDRSAWKRPSLFTALPLQALIFVMTLIYLQRPDRFNTPLDPRGDIFFNAAAQLAEAALPSDIVVYSDAYDAQIVSLYLRNRPSLRSVVEDQNPSHRPAVMIRRGNSEIPLVDKLH